MSYSESKYHHCDGITGDILHYDTFDKEWIFEASDDVYYFNVKYCLYCGAKLEDEMS